MKKYNNLICFFISFLMIMPFSLGALSFDSGTTSRMPYTQSAIDMDNDTTLESYILPQGYKDDLDIDDEISHNFRQDTPLIIAIKNNDSKKVSQLLDNLVDPNATNYDGATPLHFAALFGNLYIIKMLLLAHANPNIVDHGGNSPLHIAVDKNTFLVVKSLLQAEANPDAENYENKKPVDYAHNQQMKKILNIISKK